MLVGSWASESGDEVADEGDALLGISVCGPFVACRTAQAVQLCSASSRLGRIATYSDSSEPLCGTAWRPDGRALAVLSSSHLSLFAVPEPSTASAQSTPRSRMQLSPDHLSTAHCVTADATAVLVCGSARCEAGEAPFDALLLVSWTGDLLRALRLQPMNNGLGGRLPSYGIVDAGADAAGDGSAGMTPLRAIEVCSARSTVAFALNESGGGGGGVALIHLSASAASARDAGLRSSLGLVTGGSCLEALGASNRVQCVALSPSAHHTAAL